MFRHGLAAVVTEHQPRLTLVSATLQAEPAAPLADAALYDLACLYGPHQDLLHLLAQRVPVVGLIHPKLTDLTAQARVLGVEHFVDEKTDQASIVRAVERAAGRRRLDRSPLRGHVPFTERELQTLRLIGPGLPNSDIADQMFVSINTIETYIRGA